MQVRMFRLTDFNRQTISEGIGNGLFAVQLLSEWEASVASLAAWSSDHRMPLHITLVSGHASLAKSSSSLSSSQLIHTSTLPTRKQTEARRSSKALPTSDTPTKSLPCLHASKKSGVIRSINVVSSLLS
jgi:hypothetical protein